MIKVEQLNDTVINRDGDLILCIVDDEINISFMSIITGLTITKDTESLLLECYESIGEHINGIKVDQLELGTVSRPKISTVAVCMFVSSSILNLTILTCLFINM